MQRVRMLPCLRPADLRGSLVVLALSSAGPRSFSYSQLLRAFSQAGKASFSAAVDIKGLGGILNIRRHVRKPCQLVSEDKTRTSDPRATEVSTAGDGRTSLLTLEALIRWKKSLMIIKNAAPVAVLVLGALATGCSGSAASSASPPGSSPSQAAAASSAPATSPPTQADTAAAAKGAAVTYFDLYAAGQYAAGYQLLAPAARKAVTKRVWIRVHQQCRSSSSLAYKVTRPQLAGPIAVVNVSLAGAAAALGSEEETFAYRGGRWLFRPSDLSVYRHRRVPQIVAELKAQNLCN